MDYIYIIDNKTGKFDICTLKKEYSAFAGKTYDELTKYKESLCIDKMKLRDYENQNDLDMNAGIKQDVDNAIGTYDEKCNIVNDTVRDVEKNRADENESFRKGQALSLDNEQSRIQTEDSVVNEDKVVDSRNYLRDRIKRMKRG
jgi:hypothetical protein